MQLFAAALTSQPTQNPRAYLPTWTVQGRRVPAGVPEGREAQEAQEGREVPEYQGVPADQEVLEA